MTGTKQEELDAEHKKILLNKINSLQKLLGECKSFIVQAKPLVDKKLQDQAVELEDQILRYKNL